MNFSTCHRETLYKVRCELGAYVELVEVNICIPHNLETVDGREQSHLLVDWNKPEALRAEPCAISNASIIYSWRQNMSFMEKRIVF